MGSMKQKLIQTSIIWGLLGVYMMVSSPDKVPVLALIVPFVVLFFALYSTWQLISTLIAAYILTAKVPKRHSKVGAVFAGALVMLLVLQSLGQLTIRDVLTLAAIVVLGYLYLHRTRFNIPSSSNR